MELYPQLIEPTPQMIEDYWSLFVNQTAYSMMTDNRIEPETNRYYRPKIKKNSEDFKALTRDTIRRHMRGEITCMFYAADPATQQSKWACLDGDYNGAEADLLTLHTFFTSLGLCPLLEQSRRGGHLWLLFAEPLKSVQVRALLLGAIKACDLPVYGGDTNLPGIEVFPRQDYLDDGRLGNGVRGPLGVHRKDFKRYWFKGCPPKLEAQLTFLKAAKRLNQDLLDRCTFGMTIPPRQTDTRVSLAQSQSTRQAFSIFDHFPVPARSASDYKVRCPACSSMRLVITSRGPRKGFYHCFTGCTSADIRTALGQPLRSL